MLKHELARLELLAEIDSLVERLGEWADSAPAWETARECRGLLGRLRDRAGAMRIRMEAPLVVATLGGTGTGKSTLVNALVGEEVVRTGRERPTTLRPTLICRQDLDARQLGIDPRAVELVRRDLPELRDLVLIDCPDPDTTENPDAEDTNLWRLRQLLPHCDVLLVTTTQQKYRSARVADELAGASAGARLVFVQTHADEDDDIRDDWREVLGRQYATGHIFFVDSLQATADVRQNVEPRGEFAGLLDLLTRQLAGAAPARIRRANFLDLVDQALVACGRRMDQAEPNVERLRESIVEQRQMLAARLAKQMNDDLQDNRRQWEGRLLGKVASRWGFSPWSLVLRAYQSLGGLLSSSLLLRARTPAQIALWGTFEGARTWRKRRQEKQADRSAERTVSGCWDETELRAASVVLTGHTIEAGLDRDGAALETIADEADTAGSSFVETAAGDLESLLGRLAERHTGWFIRWRYEALLLAMVGLLLFRLGKNFFWDSWLAPQPVDVFGLDFYLSAAFWLLLWCTALLWAFTHRLRRGLRREIAELAQTWTAADTAGGVFAKLENDCEKVERFRQDLALLEQEVAGLEKRLASPEEVLGHLKDKR